MSFDKTDQEQNYRMQDDADKRYGSKNSKKGPNNSKYISIIIIVLIILTGANRLFNPSAARINPSQIALDYYLEKYGDEVDTNDVKATLRNFGCHQEIHVFKDGKLVMRASYANGRIYEIN